MARSKKYGGIYFSGFQTYKNPGMDNYGDTINSQAVKKIERETNSVFISKEEHNQELARVRKNQAKERDKEFKETMATMNEKIRREFDA